MKFTSKKDLWLGLILFSVIGINIYIGVKEFFFGKASFSEIVPSLLIAILVTVFILWLWFTTYYIFDKNELVIRSGPIHKRIPYYEIKSAKKSWNPLASPALSLKRIQINYQFGTTLISPKNRDEFLLLLKKHCPHAKIYTDKK